MISWSKCKVQGMEHWKGSRKGTDVNYTIIEESPDGWLLYNRSMDLIGKFKTSDDCVHVAYYIENRRIDKQYIDIRSPHEGHCNTQHSN